MLHKFALAVKTKTIEFFAEEDEDEDEDADRFARSLLPGADGVLAGQRVVVLKPDPPNPNPSADGDGKAASGQEAAVAAALATASSFQAAYLHLQAAHAPFLPDAAAAADAAAVSHLRRLSELKRIARDGPVANPRPPAPDGGGTTLTAHLEAQVRENQALLRSLDAVVNRLQAALDAKDAAAAALRLDLEALDGANARLAGRLDRALAPPPPPPPGGGDAVGAMLSAGVFDSVLRDALRVAHRFARALAEVLRRAGWDLAAAAEAAYPGVSYSKAGHCRYALLSRVCLSMFDGFDSHQFGATAGTAELGGTEPATTRRNESLRQFIEHSDADPMELVNSSPDCEFARFCDRKYKQLIHPGMESSLFGNAGCGTLPVMSVAGPLYELFVAMASSVWTLHRLAWAYDPAVGVFQVGRGAEFSMVYMENIVRSSKGLAGSREPGKPARRPKVGFTVVPGFRLGGTVIQCRVYLDHGKRGEETIIDSI
jgi:hypothetical protein